MNFNTVFVDCTNARLLPYQLLYEKIQTARRSRPEITNFSIEIALLPKHKIQIYQYTSSSRLKYSLNFNMVIALQLGLPLGRGGKGGEDITLFTMNYFHF